MYIQILQNFKIFQCKTRSLGCRTVFCAKNGYLARSCKTNGYLSRFLQDEWLSCKILQDFGRKSCKTMYRLARFLQDNRWLSCKILARRMVILQDSCKTDGYLARSCKILEENLARRCIVLQDFARILQDLAR